MPVVAGAAEEANGGRPFEIVVVLVVGLEAAAEAEAAGASGGERPRGKAPSSSWSRMLSGNQGPSKPRAMRA